MDPILAELKALLVRMGAATARLARRLRYQFDLSMAAGPISLIGWLALASVIVVVIAAAFLHASRISPEGSNGLGFFEAAWEAAMRTIDAGNVGGDMGWGFRLVMLIVTIWGIFVVSTLIGLLSAGVQSRLDTLRKGRSFVLERGHTVILNWSSSIFDIMAEIIVAHAKDRRFSIVILADKDKVEMEDEIAAKVRVPGNVRVVCRSGDPSDLGDLDIVNLETARSIIVVSPDIEDADSQNIKICMALVHGPHRRSAKYQIAAEFRDSGNAAIARAIGGDEVQAVVPDDLISRIIVHSSRHAGLSAVYSELLDFEGSEIYSLEMPELVGKTFGEAISLVSPGALIGLCAAGGRVELNPDMKTVIGVGDLAIVIAEDRDSAKIAEPTEFDKAAIKRARAQKPAVERALVLGWNRRGCEIARQLSCYLGPGSEIMLAADEPNFEREVAALKLLRDGVELKHQRVDTRDRDALAALAPASYDHVVVLSYSDSKPVQAADTQTLVALLHLRHIADAAGKSGTVVSEMADIRNRQLAAVTRADDFVVSNRLVSLMLAQASESPFISAIFADLLDEDGSEIYMRPIETFVSIEQPVDFYTIIEAARRRGETAFGYCRRREGETDERNLAGVALNPAKGDKLDYVKGDYIVTLARE